MRDRDGYHTSMISVGHWHRTESKGAVVLSQGVFAVAAVTVVTEWASASGRALAMKAR